MGAGAAGNAISAKQAGDQQNAIVNAQNEQLDTFLDRNDQRISEAQTLFANRRDAYDDEALAAQQADKTATETATLNEAAESAAPAAAAPIQGSSSSVISKVFDKFQSKAKEKTAAQNESLGKLRGYQGLFQDMDLDTARSGQKLGTISSLAQSDAAMLPLMQDLAGARASIDNQPSGIGALITGLANAGGYYAGSK